MFKNSLIVAAVVLCVGSPARADLVGAAPTTASTPVEMEKLQLRQVSQQNVCKRISDELTTYGVSIGLERSKSQIYALESIQKVIANFRLGDRNEFIEMRTLPFHREIDPRPENKYLNLAGILGNSLGIKGRLILGFDVNDLRFLPQVQIGSEIIMVVRTTDGMNAERAKNVVAIAKKLQVKISVIWVGSASSEKAAAFDQDALAFLAAVTGGTYADLGGNKEACALIL